MEPLIDLIDMERGMRCVLLEGALGIGVDQRSIDIVIARY
jgi:hypothetical protein